MFGTSVVRKLNKAAFSQKMCCFFFFSVPIIDIAEVILNGHSPHFPFWAWIPLTNGSGVESVCNRFYTTKATQAHLQCVSRVERFKKGPKDIRVISRRTNMKEAVLH